MTDLLVDISDFPEGWYLYIPPTYIPDREYELGSPDVVYVQMSREGLELGAGQEIVLEQNVQQAIYWFYFGNHFPNAEWVLTSWETPSELPYQSAVADRFRLACAQLRNYVLGPFQSCIAVGQYDEFISVLQIPMTQSDVTMMTYEELERILQAIDERMAQYLSE